MRSDVDAERILSLWERSHGLAATERDEALLRHVGSETDRSLSERNALLLQLHAELFSEALELLSRCPACETATEFSADVDAIIATMHTSAESTQSYQLDADGYSIEFHLPNGDDLAAVPRDVSEGKFVAMLLERCVDVCRHESNSISVSQLPARVLDALSERMESLDPGATVSFALQCPQCANAWTAFLDVGEMVWQKVRATAERTLLDVDTLARAYGWTEIEVLRLKPLRRAAYLQMVNAS